MSSATLLKSVSFRPSVNIQRKPVTQKRLGRTQLGIHAVTNWQLEPKKGNAKGQFVDLTESIAEKSTATVKSGGGDFVSICSTCRTSSTSVKLCGCSSSYTGNRRLRSPILYLQALTGLESAGLDLVFRSEGSGQSADSPADLFIKVSTYAQHADCLPKM